jgi:hypothetical protein
MHPVERLAGLFGKAPDGGCGDFDEPCHQLTLAHAAHHASRTWGGLGSDLMPIDQNHDASIALREVKGGRRPQTAGSNNDNTSRLEHGASLWLPDVSRLVFALASGRVEGTVLGLDELFAKFWHLAI